MGGGSGVGLRVCELSCSLGGSRLAWPPPPPLGGAEGSTMVKDLMSQQATLGAALLCVFMRLMQRFSWRVGSSMKVVF